MKINKVDLSKVTTYRFGGICENFITLEDPNEILNVPKNMDSSNTFVLGKGSNIAFSDNEYSGFVLKPNFDFINTVNDENKLGGGEFMLGIPGSIGGALTMNAGSYGYEISTNVIEIKCYDLDSREVLIIDKDEINYSYRKSHNLNNKLILSATLQFEKADSQIIQDKMTKFNAKRKNSQPSGIYNAGSVFKNSDNYFAGELIDNAGLKGYSVDNVSVSTKHANFFIAKKGAKALSLYKLVQYVKEQIRDKYSIDLEEEIKFIGDFN